MEFLLLAFPILIVFLFATRGRRNGKGLLPPGPPALPIIGNLHQLHNYLAAPDKLREISNKYGPLMLLKLGSVPTLIVSSAKMAKEVLKTHDAAFASRPALLSQQKYSYGGYDLAFAPYGEYWREIRKICFIHVFSSKRVQSFRYVREEEVSLMIKNLSHCKVANLSKVSRSLTCSIICRIAFSKKLEFEEDEKEESQASRFHGIVHETQALMVALFWSDYLPFMGWVATLTGLRGRLEKNFGEFDSFYQEIIDEHLEAQETRPKLARKEQDITDILLGLRKETQITFDQIKAILMNVVLGGIDTSAATIVWAMTELMKNPDAMRSVQEEVRNSVKHGGEEDLVINEEEIQKLPYLKAVVKETLRLHPAAPLLIPHEAIRKCTIDGYEIEPKTTVYVNAWAVGRDPESWESPEEFKPERFMGCNDCGPGEYKLGQDFGFIAFGAGRRGCPGMSMGVVTVELALANLLQHFDWELPGGMGREDIDAATDPGITMYKKIPLHLLPKKIMLQTQH